MRNLALAVGLVTIPFLISQPPTAARPKIHTAGPCLPSSEFSLSGLRLHQSEHGVRSTLGRPRRVTLEEDEDDGGFHAVVVLHYGHLKVAIVRGVVDRLYTDSPRASTPSGIKPGMRLGDVRRMLGGESEAFDDRLLRGQSCNETEPAYFVLEFKRDKVLSSIDISANRP